MAVILTATTKKAYSFPADSLLVRLTMKNTHVSKFEDLALALEIQSRSKSPVLMPKYLDWGVLNDSMGTGYISIQVQKKEKDGYKNIRLYGNIDNLPSEGRTDTLAFDHIKKDEFSLGGSFKSEKGEYRVRVLCFASKNNKDLNDVYSNWVDFRCLKDIRRGKG